MADTEPDLGVAAVIAATITAGPGEWSGDDAQLAELAEEIRLAALRHLIEVGQGIDAERRLAVAERQDYRLMWKDAAAEERQRLARYLLNTVDPAQDGRTVRTQCVRVVRTGQPLTAPTASYRPIPAGPVAQLIEFLTARLDELQAGLAGKHRRSDRPSTVGATYCQCGEYYAADGCPAHRQALADIAARRAIVEAFRDQQEFRVLRGLRPSLTSRVAGLEFAVLALAGPFAEHPDYEPAWAI